MANRILVVLAVVFLATFMLAQGQYGAQQSDQSQTGSATSSPTNTHIEGCLQASGDNYTLTDSTSGKTYQLKGDTSQLSAHNGHEVRLTGTTGVPSSASGMAASAAGGAEQPTFVVAKVKHISETCKSAK